MDVLAVVVEDLVVLVLDVLDELLSGFGDLAVLFHFVDVFAGCHDDDFELIVIVHPDFDQSVQAEGGKDGADLVTLVVQVSSLSEGDNSLLILNLFIRVDDDSNDEVDHQNVQQVGDQVPQYPEKEDVYPFVERNYF